MSDDSGSGNQPSKAFNWGGLVSGLFGGISSLGGLLGSQAAQRRAQQEQQQALHEMALSNSNMYQNALTSNSRTLQGMAGTGGDAINQMGMRLGDSLANGGVYNSSAVGGALVNAQRDQNSSLANLGSQLQNNAWQGYNSGLQNIGNARLGIAGQNLGMAHSSLLGAQQGVGSFLGGLAQTNLMRSGANPYRSQLPAMNGTQGQGAGLNDLMGTGGANMWGGNSPYGAGLRNLQPYNPTNVSSYFG